MLSVHGECPHCSKECGFTVVSSDVYSSSKSKGQLSKAQFDESPMFQAEQNDTAIVYCLGLCALCSEPVLLLLGVADCNIKALRECVGGDKLYRGELPKILKMYPEKVLPYAHPSLPHVVNEHFVGLQQMLQQQMPPAYIITGGRAVLEAACRQLGGEGKFLVDKIRDLKEKQLVTGILSEWAIQIKNLGNAATHELGGTHEEAVEIVDFTRIFLQYVFELPARIDEMRSAKKL